MSKTWTRISKASARASQKDPPSQEPTVATALAEVDTPTAVDLVRSAADLVQASIAENTREAYKLALRQFERSEYPETDAGVAAYLGRLYDMGRSVACAAMLVSALRFRAKLRGLPSPVGAATTRVLAGFRRLAAGRGPGQVAGVRWEQADRVAAMAEQRNHPIGLRDAAIVALAFCAGLRRSEIAALVWGDITPTARAGQQRIRVRSSKTNTDGRREDLRLLAGPFARAVETLRTATVPAAAERVVPLSPHQVNRRLQVLAVMLGLEGVSSHSGRRGLASELVRRGASTTAVQAAGGWRSAAMVARYASAVTVEDGAVARLFGGGG